MEQHRFETAHDFRSLRGVRAGADLQIHLRLRNPQLAEENFRHLFVVVLTGVDQTIMDGAPREVSRRRRRAMVALEGVDERGDFHEIGPRPGDEKELERGVHGQRGEAIIRGRKIPPVQ